MRFKNFLNEGILIKYNKETAKEDIEEAIKLILKDCQPFLKECKIPIYRGVMGVEDVLMKNTPRQDRRPKDMPEYLHKILDSLFQEHFGWKPRSSGVFCSAHLGQSQSYGNPFLFFPIGEYKYVFDSGIEDLYVKLRDDYNIPFPKMSDKEWQKLKELLEDVENMLVRRWLNKVTKSSIWLGQANNISYIINNMPKELDAFKSFIGKYNDNAIDKMERLLQNYQGKGLSNIKKNTYSEITFQCKTYYALNVLPIVHAYNTTIGNALDFIMDKIYEI